MSEGLLPQNWRREEDGLSGKKSFILLGIALVI